MSRARAGPSQGAKRVRRAIVAIVLLFASLALADALAEAARPSVAREVAAEAIGSGAAPAGMLEEAVASENGGGRGFAAPAGFEDEVVTLTDKREVRADERSRVVGFVSSGSAEEAFEATGQELERDGWTQVPSGWKTCGSFVKDVGRYRWVFVACARAGGATSVVVQYATTEEGR